MYRAETADGRSRSEGQVVVVETEAHIVRGPQDVTLERFGETILMTAEMSKPVRVVKWYKNGTEIWPVTGKYYMAVNDCIASLEIINVEKNDVGEVCAALNGREKSAPAKVPLSIIFS